MNEKWLPRKLSAILCADVVGYSRLASEDEEGTHRRLRENLDLISNEVFQHQGKVINFAGDAVLADFGTVIDALSCAIRVQNMFDTHNADLPDDRKILFRIGINLGEVITDRDNIYGDGVNVAARLEGLAEPGGVCISDAARSAVGSKLPLEYEFMGEQSVKNLKTPIRAYQVRFRSQASAETVATGNPQLELPDKPSIAVLPFTNMSGDPEQEYFADGISEDIITDLSKITSLFVIARNSSFAYKGKSVDIPTIARELGVQFVLEGSVRRGGDRVRINAQLIDAQTGGHLWAERYDRDLTDIFAVQDEVTASIVQALSVTLRKEEERLIGFKVTDDFTAYDYVLRGRDLLFRAQREDTDLTKEILGHAIELDPRLGVAYAYLTLSHLKDNVNGWSEDPQATLELAHDLARKGVDLTPDEPLVHIALGSVYLGLRRHDDAIAEVERTVQLYPNYAHGLFELGWYLQYAGRAAEALDYFDRAVRLDPHHSDYFLHFMAQAYFQLGRYEETAELLRRRIVRNPRTDSSRMLLAACYGYLDKHNQARKVWDEIEEINPDFSLEQRRKALPYKNPEDFEKIIRGLLKAGLIDLGKLSTLE